MKKIKVVQFITPIAFLAILSASDISVGDILVYKCVVDDVPTYQNIPCQAPQNSHQDHHGVLHIRSDRNVLKSSGTVPSQQTNSTASRDPEPIGYSQTYGGGESTRPIPESLPLTPEPQPNNRYDSYRFFGANPPSGENSTKPRRRFQGKQLEFRDVQPRELKFRTPQPRELQYKELQFRQVQPKQVQSRGVRGKSVQTKGIHYRTPQPKPIEPLLELDEGHSANQN